MKQILIKENDAGQRLDRLLGRYLKEAPKSFLYRMLRKKNIILNGKKRTAVNVSLPETRSEYFFRMRPGTNSPGSRKIPGRQSFPGQIWILSTRTSM